MHSFRSFRSAILLIALSAACAAAAAGCASRTASTPETTPTADRTATAAFAPPPGAWRSYQDARLGLSFDIPADWQESAPGSQAAPDEQAAEGQAATTRLEGPDGFAWVQRLPHDGAARAALCQLEANREKPARYGAFPEIVELAAGTEESAGTLPGCLILPSQDQPAGRESAALALLWPEEDLAEESAPASTLLALHASSAHMRAIATSLRLTGAAADSITEKESAQESRCDFELEETQPDVLRQGGLRVDAFPMARGASCNPLDEALAFDQRAQASAPAARAAAVLAGQWSQERLDRLNARLKPFGFRLETYEKLFRVIKNNQVLRDNINWIGQMTVKEGGNNFMLPMIDSYNASAFLLRPFGIEPLEEWDLLLFDNIFPIYAGDARLRLAYDYQRIPRPSGSPALVRVIHDDAEVIDTISVSGANPAGGPVRGLWAWQDGWLLELPGVLIQDGILLNDALGYSEMFAWRLLREKPFYLFRQQGKIQASYDGQVLPLDFDEVLYTPQWTTAMLLQIKKYENGLLFYARRGAVWYYVVIEAE